MSDTFDGIVDNIRRIFEEGKMGHGPYSVGDKEGGKGTYREVILLGMKARGAGYRVRQRLKDEFTFVDVGGVDQKFPEISRHPTVLYIDLRHFDEIPESLRTLARERDNVSLLVVDVDGKYGPGSGTQNPVPLFSSTIGTDHYITGFDRDIDPAISRIVAELYLNVDGAVEENGITLVDGNVVKPYFRTSYLVDYDRSRDILEGVLLSVIRKFSAKVIASRESIGIPPEDVRMYELARPLAERVGIESALIDRGSQEDYTIKAKIEHERVLILKDVVGDAETTIKIVDAIKRQKGFVEAVVVLLDRNEGARERLEKEHVQLYSLTDLAMYEQVVAERKAMLEAAQAKYRRIILPGEVIGDAVTKLDIVEALRKQRGLVEIGFLLDMLRGMGEEGRVRSYSPADLAMNVKLAARRRALLAPRRM
jgi:orotate phosphoribosyltransferase